MKLSFLTLVVAFFDVNQLLSFFTLLHNFENASMTMNSLPRSTTLVRRGKLNNNLFNYFLFLMHANNISFEIARVIGVFVH